MRSLFDKTEINNIKLMNRLMRSATWENMADEKGHMTSKLNRVYEDLAKGGVGLIFPAYTFETNQEQPTKNMMGIYDDLFLKEYSDLYMLRKLRKEFLLPLFWLVEISPLM